MKKTNKSLRLSLLLFLLIISNTYANKTSTPIACPYSIICSKDKSISSCQPVGENLEYWGEISASAPVKKGEYYFDTAISYYQSPTTAEDVPLCQYPQFDNGIVTGYIQIRIKPGSYLEALLTQPTDWRVSGTRADCYTGIIEPTAKDPQLCQFNKIPLVKISLTSNDYISVTAYANGISILPQPIYPQQTNVLTMYQAWDGCSDNKECTINFIANNGTSSFDIGNIIVNMENKMKILKVNSLPSSGYEIKNADSDNAIQINQLN